MCGITACLQAIPADSQALEGPLHRSLDIIKHRGPDARGLYLSPDGRVGLGHIRLSIIDLSPDGHQPFHDYEADIHAVVNGELYDHERYRMELSDRYSFQGYSDCEIVIALYKRYGLSCLSQLRGEFAFVLWDAKQQVFFAARDRYGIKSLYYTVINGRIVVATEMKQFLAFGLQPEWDVARVRDQSWLYGADTYLKGVRRILPGQYLLSKNFGPVEHHKYWDMDFPDKRLLETRTKEEMIEGVRERLVEAVKLRLRADVPVGVYLSGGIDSSAIAGIVAHLITEQGERLGNEATKELSRVKCFTVGFDKESKVDESEIARRTAESLGVDLHVIEMDEEAMARRFEDVAWHSESPLPDVNGTGKLAMAEMTHKHGIKVVITGEGSDEHFGGYPYFVLDYLREADSSLGEPLSDEERIQGRESLRGVAYKIGVREKKSIPEATQHMLNSTHYSSEIAQLHWLPFAEWTDEEYPEIQRETALAESLDGRTREAMISKWHPLHTALYMSSRTVLANILLRYLGDNIDMAFQVESRPAFLDHHLTEYVMGLPPSMRVQYNPTTADYNEKYILKEAVKPFVTEEVYNRRKQPFLGPWTYKKDGPMHRLLQRLIVRDNIDALGFVDWKKAQSTLDLAFSEEQILGKGTALRDAMTIAQFVVLGQRLGVKTARPLKVL